MDSTVSIHLSPYVLALGESILNIREPLKIPSPSGRGIYAIE
jgi:hypothetical protein